jgi:membrane protein required for colicin V production
MNNLPVSALDLVVVGIVLISALLAAVRGFTREVLAIASWAAAAAAAYALHPMVQPYLTEYIPSTNPQVAKVAAIAAVFLGTLIVVSFFTVKISDLILDSKIGALDRTLGFLFGAARGFLIAVLAFALFDFLVGEKQQPEWVRTAKLRPLLRETGEQMKAALPADILAKINERRRQQEPSEPPADASPPALAPAPAPAPTTPPAQKRTDAAPAPTYGRGQQQTLQQLVETSAGATPAKR